MKLSRLFAVAVCLGLAGAVGAWAFHYVRYTPRSTIAGSHRSVHLSGDGGWLLTLDTGKSSYDLLGPLRVWDTHSGRATSYLSGERLGRHALSPDGSIFAANVEDGTLRLVDWRAGKEQSIWISDQLESGWQPSFSPRGRYCEFADRLIEVATGQVLMTLPHCYGTRVFSRDERCLVFREDFGDLSFLDLETLSIARAACHGFELEALPGADAVMVWRLPLMSRWGRRGPRTGFELWGLNTRARCLEKEFANLAYGGEDDFSGDGRYLALSRYCEKSKQQFVEWFDLRSGAPIGAVPAAPESRHGFSPDGARLFVVHRGEELEFKLTVYDTATGSIAWERPSYLTHSRLAGATGVLLHQEFPGPVISFDLGSGDCWGWTPEDFEVHDDNLTLTPDGRTFVARGYQVREREPSFRWAWLRKALPQLFADRLPGCIVACSANGEERFRVLNKGLVARMISDDAETLVTVDSFDARRNDVVIRCWSISPCQAWIWAVASAAGSAAILLLVLRWWR